MAIETIDDDEFCTLCGELWAYCICDEILDEIEEAEDLEAEEEFYEDYYELEDHDPVVD